MTGASASTRRVTHVNANWTPATDGGDGTFDFMIVTEDEARRSFQVSPAAAQTLMAACAGDQVLLWDEEGQTLIMANLHGEWIPQDWTGL